MPNTFGKYVFVNHSNRIDCINKLYQMRFIIYFTARGMGSCNGDAIKAYEKYYKYTFDQLMLWGCLFNELYLGKLTPIFILIKQPLI